MIRDANIDVVENSGDTLDYLQAKQLLTEKKELQARLRDINRDLRQLQSRVPNVMNLAKEHVERQMNESARPEKPRAFPFKIK